MSQITRALFAALLLLIPATAEAHKPSDSTLSLIIEDTTIQGRWAIALRDLDYAFGLDGDGNGEITWGEVRARHEDIAAYALSRLDLHSDNVNCPTTAGEQEIENRSDGTYTVLRFTAACEGTVEDFEARYFLFFDLDPQHRGLLQVDWNGVNSTTILSPSRSSWRAQDGEASPWTQAAVYTVEGVWHIWKGIDHVLFLLSLLLPAVLLRGVGGGWTTKEPRAAFIEVLAACEGTVEDFEARYFLFFDLDPQHRGLLQVDWNGVNSTTILSPSRSSWRAQDGEASPWTQAAVYTVEGVWHIWKGIDHVLFLLSLLLPAVLLRGAGGGWTTKEPRAAFIEVVKVVTAFTIAHSITLGLASVGWIDLPSRLIEPIIAASIVIAALNNIVPVVSRGIWLVAFGFGLVHGVGFATALSELGLPSKGLLLSLFSFNLGVEMGQLAIVGVFLPAAIWFARTRFYLPVAMRFGSFAIATIASIWFVEAMVAFGIFGRA